MTIDQHPKPAQVEQGDHRQCPNSPDGRHQVDTSMESGPNNCFHCEAPMPPWKVARSVDDEFTAVYPDTGRMEFPLAKKPEFMRDDVWEAVANLIVTAVNSATRLASSREPAQVEQACIDAVQAVIAAYCQSRMVPPPIATNIWSKQPVKDAFARLATQSPAAEPDAWEQVGYWKEKAEQAERRQQDFNSEHLPKYQKALADNAELERKLAIAEEALAPIAAMRDVFGRGSHGRVGDREIIAAYEALAQIRTGGGG